MIMTPMSDYLRSILSPFLARRGVSESFIDYTAQVIEQQGTSLLRNWDDLSFRKTMLLLGSEEGPFYEPAGKTDIKCFVVIAIRNSPLETIQSENYQEAGLTTALSSDDVKAITGSAIRYFNPLDFSLLAQKAKACDHPDLYRDIAAKYSVAWAALRSLGSTSAKVIDYPSVPVIAPYQFPQHLLPAAGSSTNGAQTGRMAVSCYDGYTPAIDAILLEQLQKIVNIPNGVLLVDAFKTASRNFEKLLQIIEYILTRGKAFVTSNYYLENGHVERRIFPLRAGHTVKEMQYHFTQTSGLGIKHSAALKALTKGSR